MPSEADLVRKIKKALIADGAYAAKIHGGRFSAGVPDLLVCVRGCFVGLEVKLPGKEKTVTALQEQNITAIVYADGVAKVVTSVKQAKEAVAWALRQNDL